MPQVALFSCRDRLALQPLTRYVTRQECGRTIRFYSESRIAQVERSHSVERGGR